YMVCLMRRLVALTDVAPTGGKPCSASISCSTSSCAANRNCRYRGIHGMRQDPSKQSSGAEVCALALVSLRAGFGDDQPNVRDEMSRERRSWLQRHPFSAEQETCASWPEWLSFLD